MSDLEAAERMPVPDVIVVPRKPATRAILAAAAAFGIEPAKLIGHRRWRKAVYPRQIAMGMLRMTPYVDGSQRPFAAVGREFGGRDHTTVLYAARRYARWCEGAGLDPVPVDFDVSARILARHLGVVPPSDTSSEALAADFSSSQPDDGGAPMPETIPPAPAAAITPAPKPAPVLEPLLGEPELGAFRIALEDWLDLPAAMQADGALLAVEHAGSIEAASEVTGLPQDVLARCFGLRAQPHDLPRIVESKWTPADEPAPRDSYAPAPPSACDAGLLAFAQIHLAAGAALHVPDAYATYRAFCAGRHAAVMPRASFGAALLEMARRHGGSRSGETIEGLVLREGRKAPASEAVPARVKSSAKPVRAPLTLGIAAVRRAGRRVIEIGLDGSRHEQWTQS